MRIIYYLFIFFCAFPFITFYHFGTDTQPYALIISIIIVGINLIRNKRINWMILSLLFVAFSSLAVLMVYKDFSFNSIRGVSNYLSVFFVSSAAYFIICHFNGINEKYVKLFINIWFIVGAVQFLLNRDFLNFMIAGGGRTSADRGVVGLASEPSFYGYMIIFALFFAINFKRDKYLYILNLMIQLFVFAQSSLGTLFLTIYISIKLFALFIESKQKLRALLLGVLIASIFILVLFINMSYFENRTANLLRSFVNDPITFFETDDSTIGRFDHLFNSVSMAFSEFLIPHGYNSGITISGRIMSGYGTALYEMGFLGLFLIILIYNIVVKGASKSNALFITIMMFAAVQLILPTFSFYLGYCIYCANNRHKCQVDDRIENHFYSMYNASQIQ